MHSPSMEFRRTLPPPEPDGADERHIMQQAQRDPAAFAPLYERYFDRVYAYCLRRAADAREAEDLCSQVFMRALAGIKTYQGGMVAAWLFQIAHNVVVSHYRQRRQVVALDDFDLLPDDSTADQIEQAEEARLMRQLVAALPAEQQHLLALTLDAGLTSVEIGAALGKSPVSIRVQLHRIIQKLRQRYLQVTEARTHE